MGTQWFITITTIETTFGISINPYKTETVLLLLSAGLRVRHRFAYDWGKLPAPPHDASGHTWHHSDDQLFKITKLGVAAVVPNYESDMIGFGDKLSDEEIRAVIEYIMSTWPPRQREYQEQRNQVQQ